MAAAEWTRDNPGPFVDTHGAAEIVGHAAVRRPAGGPGTPAVAAHGALGWAADAGLPARADRSHRAGTEGSRRRVVAASIAHLGYGP
jgi:hypothetical protein